MRARVLVLLACLFLGGVPAVVFFTITRTAARDGAWSGAQPGGVVRGVVRDTAGQALAGALVEVRAGHWAPKSKTPGRLVQASDDLAFDETHTVRVETGPDGLYEIAVDPVEGVYVLRASLEEFEACERFFSFLDAERNPIAVPPPVNFELPRSVRLVVELELKSGAGELRGGYQLEHRGTRWWGLGTTTRIWTGSFDGGTFAVDRLVPGAAHLSISTLDGRRFESDVELAVGTLTLRARL
ncbi:MAG: carboxypeptidase regulatory-like domain-containing protein [Planctomycetes bacterium]|nr:carboxypeptidase regulatory-like domain-containing protein [Planctomycetota bacterium]